MPELTPAARRLGLFLGSGRQHMTLDSLGRDPPLTAAGQKRIVGKVWREFFLDPSQWWDHRSEKANARYPDFKHKKTQEALWLNGKFNPPWVEEKLAGMAPGTVQSNIFSWNARLARYVKVGQYQKTMELFQQMQEEGINPDRFTFIPVLNACSSLGALKEGRRIHTQIMQSGCGSDVYVGTSLVDMYAKCGRIEDAQKIFNKMPTHNVVSWNVMIQGLVKCGKSQRALELFKQMQQEGVEADTVTFVGFLNACASAHALEVGKSLHEQVIQRGFECDAFVGSSLVDMYAKCGSIKDAWIVFSKMTTRTVVAWSAMIQGYVKCGQGQKALELSQQVRKEGVEPDSVMFVGLINACASVGSLEEGKNIHEQVIRRGFECDVFVGSSLVDMYAKCGSIEDAQRVFNKMPTRNVVAWSVLIQGYVKCGQGQKALEVFQQMQGGVEPSIVTFVGLLNACASIGALEEGIHVREQIAQRGFESNIIVGSSLVDMYAKCGSIEDAWRVFDKMPTCNVVTWSAMIQGYVKCGQGHKALKIYQQMQEEGVEPNTVTFASLLNACASVVALDEGRKIHEQVIERALESDAFVVTSLVNMYAKCGSIEDAWGVFNKIPTHNVVSWNAMIQGHVKSGQGYKALELFQCMEQEGVEPDSVTFVAALNACASVGALEEGRHIHKQTIQRGVESDVFVGNSLIDMYAKCGRIEDAQKVFDKIPVRSVVSWNAMILGHVKCGQGQMALELSRLMEQEGVGTDPVTFMGMLNACASVAALEEGRHIHQRIIQSGVESDLFVGNSLLDMYAKCGSIEDAWRVFNVMPSRNVVSWNAMLGGLSLHGHPKEILAHFEQMCLDSVDIDSITFVSLLSACSHAGLVDEGLHFFESMDSVYSIPARLDHYACMVDLLGRAGRLHEAEDLIQAIPCEPDPTAWMSLLGACRIHGNVGMGERIAKQVLRLDPGNVGGYVLLSNIYAAAGKWDSRAKVQEERLESGVTKQPGRTWIEVNNAVHSFTVDDQEHPQILEIHAELERLSGQMKKIGYIPDVTLALHDVDEEEKVSLLGLHSEKLAIAFGLISTPSGTPLCIFKNLQVCGDCHTATKFISKIVARTIIVWDANRFHHFEDGLCSCRDYW